MKAPVDVEALREIEDREIVLDEDAERIEGTNAANASAHEGLVARTLEAAPASEALRASSRLDGARLRHTMLCVEAHIIRHYAQAAGLRAPPLPGRAELALELRHLADALDADAWPQTAAAAQLGIDAAWARAELAKVSSW